jgi:hypothetical protein
VRPYLEKTPITKRAGGVSSKPQYYKKKKKKKKKKQPNHHPVVSPDVSHSLHPLLAHALITGRIPGF